VASATERAPPRANEYGLRVPGFRPKEQACAACEVIARTLEERMAAGAHHGVTGRRGAHERLTVLSELCEGIEQLVPSPIRSHAPTQTLVLQFDALSPESAEDLRRKGKTPEAVPDFGLRDFCYGLVEEHEGALSSKVMVEAEELARRSGRPLKERGYDLKGAVCVELTKSCTADGLERIVSARKGGAARTGGGKGSKARRPSSSTDHDAAAAGAAHGLDYYLGSVLARLVSEAISIGEVAWRGGLASSPSSAVALLGGLGVTTAALCVGGRTALRRTPSH
jgi:hypothetical protein